MGDRKSKTMLTKRFPAINWGKLTSSSIGFFAVVCIIYFLALNHRQEHEPDQQKQSPVTYVKEALKDAVSDKPVERIIEKCPICYLNPLKSSKQFFEYFNLTEYTCKNYKKFGRGDGGKATCLDKVFDLKPSNCNVLSFGISNEWSFDDAFARYGCKVYSFDPTMGRRDHRRSTNIWFFNLGISNYKGEKFLNQRPNCKVDRYVNILEKLNLKDATIDYLKMDVEGSEFDFFQDVFRNTPYLLKNIKQIGMEIHHSFYKTEVEAMYGFSKYVVLWHYFEELRCHGFKMVSARRNEGATEMHWVQV